MKPNESDLTPQQQAMIDVWEKHMRAEFVDHSADAALATMSATPHLNHVPVMTGARLETIRHEAQLWGRLGL